MLSSGECPFLSPEPQDPWPWRPIRTRVRNWVGTSMPRPALLPMPPELAEFWPWAIGGQAMDYKAMGQQRGVAREDFSGGLKLELSPK